MHQCHLDTLNMGKAYYLHHRYRKKKLDRTVLRANMYQLNRELKTTPDLHVIVVYVANRRWNALLVE